LLLLGRAELVHDTSAGCANRGGATKSIDGASVTGWFTEDLTLTELKTLRARERMPAIRQRNTLYDGRYLVPTLQEIVDLVRRESRIRRRSIGIYAETKHPGYFASIGLPLRAGGLAWIASYAVGIGVEAARVIPLDTFGATLPGTTLVDDPHAQGLTVYAWTVRNENVFLPANYRRGGNPIDFGDALGWFGHVLEQGVDGVFSDHPDTALVAAGLAAST
jgi:glycerophosphoryl diester phosphodiesterase